MSGPLTHAFSVAWKGKKSEHTFHSHKVDFFVVHKVKIWKWLHKVEGKGRNKSHNCHAFSHLWIDELHAQIPLLLGSDSWLWQIANVSKKQLWQASRKKQNTIDYAPATLDFGLWTLYLYELGSKFQKQKASGLGYRQYLVLVMWLISDLYHYIRDMHVHPSENLEMIAHGADYCLLITDFTDSLFFGQKSAKNK